MKNRPEVTGNFSALLVRRKQGPTRPQSQSTLSLASTCWHLSSTQREGWDKGRAGHCCGTRARDGDKELRVASHQDFVNWGVFEYVKWSRVDRLKHTDGYKAEPQPWLPMGREPLTEPRQAGGASRCCRQPKNLIQKSHFF